MLREKDILRKQVYEALKQQDFETARKAMSEICSNEKHYPKQRTWSDDETEFLMHHVAALGKEKGCKVVAKKLDRTELGVKKKYSAINKKKKLVSV